MHINKVSVRKWCNGVPKTGIIHVCPMLSKKDQIGLWEPLWTYAAFLKGAFSLIIPWAHPTWQFDVVAPYGMSKTSQPEPLVALCLQIYCWHWGKGDIQNPTERLHILLVVGGQKRRDAHHAALYASSTVVVELWAHVQSGLKLIRRVDFATWR